MSSQNPKVSPKERADCLSVLFFGWVKNILYTGWKSKLTEDDVHPILYSDHSALLGSRLEHNWFQDLEKCSKQNKKPCFRWTVFRTFGPSFLFYGIFSMIEECVFRMIQVVSLGYLINYFSEENPKLVTKTMAQLACVGIILSSIAFMVSFHWSLYSTHHVCTHMRLAVSSLIYRKMLRLSQATMRSFSVGQLITMLSSDVHRFDMKDLHLNYLWVAPIHLSIVIYLLFVHYDFGFASLGGLLLLVTFVIFQYILNIYVSKVRMEKIGSTNKRMRVVTEIMKAFYTIKLYAWENIFYSQARKIRKEELKYIKKTMILRILNTSLSLILSKMTVFLTLLFYIFYDKRPLDSEKIFITLLLYEHVRVNLAYLFAQGANDWAEVSVTFTRMTEFLLLEEKYAHPESYVIKTVDPHGSLLSVPLNGISVDNITCKWHSEQESPTLDSISLEITEGKLIAVVGPVGSGKSSLLSALIGELPALTGKISVQGKISYVSQTPWLFPGTVRQNIIFGKMYNPTWYKEVIEICGLQADLENMTDGDQTKVIHAGLSLGQQARISLARAVYSNSDIYLMDDPLNCVDVRLSRHILEICIRGALKNKAVLFVTHQLHFLEAADNIAILMQGKIRAIGTFKELTEAGIQFAKEVDDFVDGEEIINEEMISTRRRSVMVVEEEEQTHTITVKELVPLANNQFDSTPNNAESLPTKSALVVKDIEASDEMYDKMIEPDKIGIRLYWAYIKSSSSWLLIIFLIVVCCLVQLLYSGSDYWLEHWIEGEEEELVLESNGHEPSPEFIKERNSQIIIYCSLIPALVIVTILRSIAMYRICIKASMTLFCQLLKSLLRAKSKFLEANCTGHGINRFSKDMIVIDELLPNTLYDITGVFFEIIGAVIILGYTNYYFVIPCLIFLAVIIILFQLYHKSAATLKRFEANERSPVYAHTTKTLEGLTSIRAYEQQRIFLKIYDDLQDKHTANWLLYIQIHAWLAVVIDWISILLIIAVTVSFLIMDDSEPAKVGLAVAKVIELSILMQMAVLDAADAETEMISVERILEYTHEESEALWENPNNKPPKNWPNEGHIVFKNLFVQGYKTRQLLVDVSCEIKAGQKIGIVGRSGAGKSTFINALFRITEPKAGTILIDNVNILELGLHDLRRKLSVIPQIPHVFAGSLRMNLDPFDEYHDKDLWAVLEEVNLFETVKTLESGLDTQFTETGWHFSVGQSQLLCLARAMLQKNQILCCDEATANLDPQTQSLMLKKIKEHFNKCTVITVAHRLHTIIDCDKIMVVEAGQIIDFGDPVSLIKSQGPFYSLIQHLGRKNADDIIRLAKESSVRNKNSNTQRVFSDDEIVIKG